MKKPFFAVASQFAFILRGPAPSSFETQACGLLLRMKGRGCLEGRRQTETLPSSPEFSHFRFSMIKWLTPSGDSSAKAAKDWRRLCFAVRQAPFWGGFRAVFPMSVGPMGSGDPPRNGES
ncbi:hypothetical protein CW354_06530 [Marinicaulis flavus]|uniref:Uncharacterized protein n=1 Tax=Hyphococcus luteus TaxID=2058213 RepID=A0A2S7K662_9PROT|nr:hypothetical protein CW354_06530 [Marinicaulis flavus]